MRYAGLDVHKRCTQICIQEEDGVLYERRILTERYRLIEEFGKRPKMRMLIEASTESEWVARCLEELGHEVIVGDPNYGPMYAQRSRRVKTDKRDAHALLEACKLGAYKAAHRCSDANKRVRARIAIRDSLVMTRTKFISLVRSFLRQEGIKPERKSSATFTRRVRLLGEVPASLAIEIAPMLDAIDVLSKKIRDADEQVEQLAQAETPQRLMSCPGVGAITAVAFLSQLDEPKRFKSAKQVRAYLGLVPREHSSGEKCSRGHITKQGGTRMRRLLVQAAWAVLRSRATLEAEPLRRWHAAVASRRGKYVAVVGLARRLAGILFALWRDGTTFQPPALPPPAPEATMA
jgi:transposase